MKDLGIANGWRETPPELITCSDQDHKISTINIGKCLTKFICPICKIKWEVDSSD